MSRDWPVTRIGGSFPEGKWRPTLHRIRAVFRVENYWKGRGR